MAKKILIYRWKAYGYQDLIKVFRELDFEVDEVSQHLMNYEVDEEFSETLRKKIKENHYAFLFTINYFPLIAETCHEEGLPYVSWACDSPLISMYHKSVFYDTNYIFHFDQAAEKEFYDMGVRNLWHLPLATDMERNQSVIDNPGQVAGVQHDITFVGRLYDRNSYDRIEPELSEYLRGYMDSAILAQANLYGANIIDRILTPEILTELSQKFELHKSDDSFSSLGLIFETTTLGFKIAQVQRTRALTELSKKYPHRVFLYTTVPTEDLMLVENMGPLDYWNEAPYIFKNSKINLNLTIPNIRMGIPLRVWDILGSGGVCLTNYQVELEQYFTNGRELMWFKTEEEMMERAEFLLTHDREREKMQETALAMSHELGGYKERIQEIINLLKEKGVCHDFL